MKKIIFLAVSLSLFLIVGCTKEEVSSPKSSQGSSQGSTLKVTLSSSQKTRITPTEDHTSRIELKWKKDDKIELYFKQGEQFTKTEVVIGETDISDDGKKAQFTIDVPAEIDKSSAYTLYGIHGTDTKLLESGKKLVVNTKRQWFNYLEKITIPIYFKVDVAAGESPEVNAICQHLGAMIALTVDNGAGLELSGRVNISGTLGIDNGFGNEGYVYRNLEDLSEKFNLKPDPMPVIHYDEFTFPPNTVKSLMMWAFPSNVPLTDRDAIDVIIGEYATTESLKRANPSLLIPGVIYHLYVKWNAHELFFNKPYIELVPQSSHSHCTLLIDAPEHERRGVWIDVNNNGVMEPGVDILSEDIAFGQKKKYKLTEVLLGQKQKFTIYGNITKLDCSINGLSELIIDNKYLTYLDCSRNYLTTLYCINLEGLSYLDCSRNRIKYLGGINRGIRDPELTYLDCSYNYLVRTPDLYNNTELIYLDVSGNDLTSLRLPNAYHSALQYFKCRDNLLESLSLSQYNELTYLDCSNNKIQGLYIDQTPLLTYLDCSDNKLTSLYINYKLTYLDCSGNKFQSLEPPSSTTLTHLICSHNSLLQSLDLSEHRALTYLKCDTTSLTSLDISKCIALDTLYCRDNAFQSLDFSNSRSLTYLDCSLNKKLESLNLSGATALTHLDFKWNMIPLTLNLTGATALTELDCSDTQLQSLNVSGTTALTQLHCPNNQLQSLDVSGATALIKLNCDGNQLQSLDVSGATTLYELYCNNNQLQSLKLSKRLTGLYCSNNKLESLDMSAPSLMFFYCNDNLLKSLDLTDLDILYKVHCGNNQLKTLILPGMLTTLRALNCSNNQLQSLDVRNGKNYLFYEEYTVTTEPFNSTGNPNLTTIWVDKDFTPPSNWKKDAHASWVNSW